MEDRNELEALRASLRGAIAAAGGLQALAARLDAADAAGDPDRALLDDIQRLAAANAVAAHALRGLVESLLRRRAAE